MSINRSDISGWIPGYSYDMNDIIIDRAAEGGLSDKGLSEAKATDTTGDVAEVLRSLMEVLFQNYIGIDREDRPDNMIIRKGVSVDEVTGVQTKTYNVAFRCASEGVSVIPEE